MENMMNKNPQELSDESINDIDLTRNPVRNPVVLGTLSKYFGPKDLANFRLVSKLWYNASLEMWRSNAVLTVKRIEVENFQFPRSFEYDDRDAPSPTGNRFVVRAELPEFFELYPGPEMENDMFKLANRPYSRYRVKKGFSPDVEGMLWNVCGVWMQELHLDSCHLISFRNWRTIVFEKTPNLKKLILSGSLPSSRTITYLGDVAPPNKMKLIDERVTQAPIQQLNLRTLDLRSDDWLWGFPVLWVEFLSFFPKLEEVFLPLGHFDVHDTHESFLAAVESVKAMDATYLPIKTLDTISHGYYSPILKFSSTNLKLLTNIGFSLTTLNVDIGSEMDMDLVHQLINLYVGTLQSLLLLKGFGRPNKPEYFFTFPQPMRFLHTLELAGPVVNNMSFLQFTPNLEKLIINRKYRSGYRLENDGTGNDEDDGVRENSKTATEMVDDIEKLNANLKLSKLREFQAYFKLELASSVQILGKWMPNLEVLRVPVSARAFSAILEQWQHTLRDFTLAGGSSVDDDIITGVPKCGGSRPPIMHTDCRRPVNITLLKNLQIFRMEKRCCFDRPPCFHEAPRLTDFCIVYGFKDLPRLHTLRLLMRREIGQWFQRALEKNRVNVSVSTSSCHHSLEED